MKKILIADDHAMVREAMAQRVTGLGYRVVGQAGDTEHALHMAEEEEADIVILDVEMPGDSLAAVETMRRSRPRPRILVLSAHEETEVAIRFLRAGADGYLLKSAPSDQLPAALERLAGRGKYLSTELAVFLASAVEGENRSISALSQREEEVVRSIADGYTVTEIAQGTGLSVKTVSTYRRRALEKMGLQTNVDLVRYFHHS